MIYGYLRVSSDEQDVNSQRQGVDAFAAARGWTIEKYISDEGVSGGKDPDKRNLGPMLKKLKKGDVVICSEISRLGRDLYMVMDILHFCMTREVVIHTVKDGFTLGDSIQSKVLAFAFGLSAEIERQMIRQRTKEGLALRRKMGVLMGRPITEKSSQKTKCSVRMNKYKDLIIEHYKAGVPQREIAKLFGISKDTVLTYIIKWGEYNGDVKGMQKKREISRLNRIERQRTKHAGKQETRLCELGKERLMRLIVEDLTIPVIAQQFPDYTYEEVYDCIYLDRELNQLYRKHGQKFAKREYESSKRMR